MRSDLQELFTCPRAGCRNTELCHGMAWLVFALPKALAVFRNTTIVPLAPHTREGVNGVRGWRFGPCGDALLEGLVSSRPIPIFSCTCLGLEHSVHRRKAACVGFLGKTRCLLLPMPRSSYCEHLLQVTFVTSEVLPGIQQRRVYPNWGLHWVLFPFPSTTGQTISRFHQKTRKTVLCLWRSSRGESAERTAPRWVMRR